MAGVRSAYGVGLKLSNMMKRATYSQSATNVWQVQPVHAQTAKPRAVHSGDELVWGSACRFRHVSSGRYLIVTMDESGGYAVSTAPEMPFVEEVRSTDGSPPPTTLDPPLATTRSCTACAVHVTMACSSYSSRATPCSHSARSHSPPAPSRCCLSWTTRRRPASRCRSHLSAACDTGPQGCTWCCQTRRSSLLRPRPPLSMMMALRRQSQG